MGILGTIGTDVNSVAEQTVMSGGGVVESGLFPLLIVDAYMYKNKGGTSTKLNVKYKINDGSDREFFTDKPLLNAENKPYEFAPAKDGKPGRSSVDALVNLIKAVGLTDSEQEAGEIEMGSDKVKIARLKDLVGKEFIGGVRKCEDDYKENVPFINEVEQFFASNYHTSDVDAARAKDWTDMIDKVPIKLKKNKKKAGGAAATTAKAGAAVDVGALI